MGLSLCPEGPRETLDPRLWLAAWRQRNMAAKWGRWALVAANSGAGSAVATTRRVKMVTAYPTWLSTGDTSWQLTAATLVGLMSVPGLVVLYGGVMQKRWSINSMMLTFVAFSVVLVVWVLWASRWASAPRSTGSRARVLRQLHRQAGPRAQPHREQQGQANIPLTRDCRVVPAVLARLLPVRVRGDHADPGARLGARTGQLQGVDPVRARSVDHVRLLASTRS